MSNLPAIIEKPLRVLACPHPFRDEREEFFLEPVMSLAEVLAEVQPDIFLRRRAHVWLNDDYIPPELWDTTFPAPGSDIYIRVAPSGSVGRAIGSIFVAIAAIAAAFIVPWALGLTGIVASIVGGLAGAAVTVLGNLALNALIPPTSNPARQAQITGTGISFGSSISDSPTYSLSGGSNVANKFGPIPKVLGKHKSFPNYGAETYTEIIGNDQYLRLYFVWGFAPLQVSNLKIGDTPINNYEGVETQHRNLTLVLSSLTIAINTSAKTLTRSTGSWTADGIEVGNTVTLGGCTTPANNTDYLISAVTALALTYTTSTATTTEAGTGSQTATIIFGDEALTLYPDKDIHEDTESILLEKDVRSIRTAQAGSSEITVDLTCPNGLYTNDRYSGARNTKSVQIKIEIRESPAGAWSILETVTISAATSSAVRKGLRYTAPGSGAYDIGMTRLTDVDDSFSMSLTYWSAIRSIKSIEPVNCPVAISKTILRIKASNELNGTVDKLSGLVESIQLDWDADTETWVLGLSQNPASLMREMVQGSHRQDPFLDAELDLAKIQYWHEYCETEGWEYNKIIDYSVDLWEVISEISAAGRAARTWKDSKLSVIIDEPQEFTIGPAFTPRNSNGFKSTIVYPETVHAWRIAFKNELLDYQDDERVVLDDEYSIEGLDAWGNISEQDSGALVVGKRYLITATEPDHFYAGCAVGETFTATDTTALDEDNKVDWPIATIFKELPLSGITHPDLIFRHGRYHIAGLRLRFETHEFDAHVEHLIATRGDRIKFAHDVLLVGLAWGRVKALDMEMVGETPTGNLAGVTLDEPCPMEEGTDYGIQLSKNDNSLVIATVDTVAGTDNYSLTFTSPIPPEDLWPEVGNIFMFGPAGNESIDLIIKSIRPDANLNAKITAVAYDENLYLADVGTIPAHDSGITPPVEWWTPIIDDVRSGGDVLIRDVDGSWKSRILLTFRRIAGISPRISGVEAQFWRSDSASGPVTTVGPVCLDDGEISLIPVEDGVEYDLRCRYTKIDGSRGPWTATETHTVEGKTAPPEDVTGFVVYQIPNFVTAVWNPVGDKDLADYEIRYGEVGAAWSTCAIVNGTYRGTTFSTSNLPPGTWDVMIKAKDTSGNYSETEARKTFLVYQFYAVLSQISHWPLWKGTLTNFIRNPRTGNLIPRSQDPVGDNFDWVDNFVANPYPESSFETEEIDLGSDEVARAWARIYANLGPGETGIVDPQLQVDYKLDGQDYDGFEDWTIGYFEGRKVKFKFTVDNTVGVCRITGFQPTIDQPT